MNQHTVAQLIFQIILKKLINENDIPICCSEEAYDDYADTIGLNAYLLAEKLATWSPKGVGDFDDE